MNEQNQNINNGMPNNSGEIPVTNNINLGVNQNMPNQNVYNQPMNLNNNREINGGETNYQNQINGSINQMSNEQMLTNNNSVYPQPTVKKENISEMDDSFVEPKKKGHAALIFLILLILIIGATAAYYFVIDAPDKIFTKATETLFSGAESKVTKKDKINLNYNLGLNVTTESEDYKQFTDLLKNVNLSGTISIDNNNDTFSGTSLVKYKNEELINLTALLELKDNGNMYFKFNDILDKVIKIDLSNDEEKPESINNHNISAEDYKQVLSSISNVLKQALTNAEYKKEITKLNDEYVKKVTLIADKEFCKEIYTKLLQDNNFLESYAKITDSTVEKVTDDLNKDMDDLEDGIEELTIYLTLLKNEFLKFTYTGKEEGMNITKESDKYSFELSESYSTKYEGNFNLKEVGNEKVLNLYLRMVDKKTTIDLSLIYSKNDNDIIIDTTNAQDIENLSEEDMNKITSSMSENKAFNNLLEDLGITDTDDLISSQTL